MKVIQLLSRGVDGCGVTRFAVEFEKYLKANGYDFSTVAIDDKKWTRKDAHDFLNLKKYRLKKEPERQAFLDEVATGDILIVESLPPAKSEQWVVDAHLKAVQDFKGKVVLIQHDHNIHSMRRNMCMKETIEIAHKVFAHATKDSDFCRWVAKEFPPSVFGDTKEVEIINFQPGMDFDDIRSQFWKDIDETDPMHHKWIGRTAGFKGPEFMIDWSKELALVGFATSMEGFERSMGWVAIRDNYTFNDCMDIDVESVDMSEQRGKLACLFKEYIHDPLMHRLSTCAFGYQLSKLDPRFIERSIEYTHCEVVAAGTIPVFRKAYFDNVTHAKTGNKITSDKNTGAIYLPENIDEQVALIPEFLALANDKVLRNERREMAFEYFKSHQSASDTYAAIMKEILK